MHLILIIATILIICISYVIIGFATSKFIMRSYCNGKSLLHDSNIPPLYGYISGDNYVPSMAEEASNWIWFWPIFFIALGIKFIFCVGKTKIVKVENHLTKYAEVCKQN